MNLSLLDSGGGLLLVPQFTLAADTARGCGQASPAQRRRNSASGSSHMPLVVHGGNSTSASRWVFRRAHAGVADQRRSRHVLAAGSGYD